MSLRQNPFAILIKSTDWHFRHSYYADFVASASRVESVDLSENQNREVKIVQAAHAPPVDWGTPDKSISSSGVLKNGLCKKRNLEAEGEQCFERSFFHWLFSACLADVAVAAPRKTETNATIPTNLP